MQCLANLSRTHKGVQAALQAELPLSITETVKQVGVQLYTAAVHSMMTQDGTHQ